MIVNMWFGEGIIMSVKQKKLAALIAGLAVMLCVGILYMWSVFQSYVMNYHGWSSADVSMTSALMIAFFVIGNILCGLVQEKYDPRLLSLVGGLMFSCGMFLTSFVGSKYPWMLYITYSLISGLGCGIAYSNVLSALQKWYASKSGMITGLTVCFFGLSVVILSPITESLLSNMGVPATFRILSIVFLVVISIASLFVTKPDVAYYRQEASLVLNPDEFKQFTPKEVIKSPIYYYISVSLFFSSGAYLMLVPFIMTIAMARGMDSQMALIAVMSTGVGNAAGRIIAPAVSDKFGRTNTIIACCILSAIACILMISATDIMYIVAIFLIAFAYGGNSGTNPVISTELFGATNSGTNYGLILISLAVSSITFGKLSTAAGSAAGGDFTTVLIICAAVCIVPIILMLCLRRLCWVKGGKRI